MTVNVRKEPILLIAAIVASWFIAPHLPFWFGWENGPVEDTQALLLFIGGVIAVRYAAKAPTSQQRAFWLMVIPFWFVMTLRELSWGAVLMTPLTLSAEMGPKFSSSVQLWYKPVIAPICALLLLFCAVTFVKTRQYLTLAALWKDKAFPLAEIVICAVALVISGGSEGHMGFAYGWPHQWALQNLEELTELCAYLALFAAQLRVRRSFLKT